MEIRAIPDLSPDERRAVFDRSAGIDAVRGDVRSIVDRVREEGDVAVRELTGEHDGVDVGNLDVGGDAERAYDRLDDELRGAIEEAVANVREFHERQRPEDWRHEYDDGRTLGRRFRAIDRVGVYVPGGRAAYPSSAVMGVVPAVVAGVDQVAVATPPGEDGDPADATLAAAHAAGADRVYRVGGAQAVAALAYGTETVDRVRKVVGPGNRWVTAAKAELRGRNEIEIDALAGPSELLVVCDATADPDLVAADLLAQAEHDPDAAVAAVTADRPTAEAVLAAVDRQLPERTRRETIESALDNDSSGVFLARSESEAVLFADEYAPEHCSVQVDPDEEEPVADRLTDVGGLFLGPYSPVAAGDYATGTNHVLPTGGGARVTGGLSVEDFLRATTVERLSERGLSTVADAVTTLATAEGLEAHAASVRRRFRGADHDPGGGPDGDRENDGSDQGGDADGDGPGDDRDAPDDR